MTREFQASNGQTFAPNSNRVIRIPLSSDDFLSGNESYLRFTVNNKSKTNGGADTAVSLDHSCHSLFERVRLEAPDGTEIDRIDNYNVLACMLGDWQHGAGWRTTVGYSTSGYSRVRNFTDGQGVLILPDYDGSTASISANGSKTFTMPIIGTFLSNSKMIPLKYMGSGLVLELTLAPASDALISSTRQPAVNNQSTPQRTNNDVLDYDMSNIAYVGRLLSFSRLFEEAFEAVLAEGEQMGVPMIQFHSPSYRNYVYNAGTGDFNVPVAERASSIKSMFAVFRGQLSNNGSGNSRVGSRSRDNINSYQFRVGNVLYPQSRVNISATNSGEAYSEMKKALGTLHSLDDQGIVVRQDHYISNSNFVEGVLRLQPDWIRDDNGAPIANYNGLSASGEYYGKFTIGMDFENFSHENYQSGLDTTNHAMNIELLVTRSAPSNALRVDVFTLIDQVVTLNANQSITVSR
jgi:hypothetical protein